MTITISHSTLSPVTVEEVIDYSADQESRNLVHPIIGRTDPDVTLRPAAMRRGTLEIWCSTEEQADSVAYLHTRQGTLYYEDTGHSYAGMWYVVDGRVSRLFDFETATWRVRVDYQEVRP